MPKRIQNHIDLYCVGWACSMLIAKMTEKSQHWQFHQLSWTNPSSAVFKKKNIFFKPIRQHCITHCFKRLSHLLCAKPPTAKWVTDEWIINVLVLSLYAICFSYPYRVWAGVRKPLLWIYLVQFCLNPHLQLASHYCPVKGSLPQQGNPERWRQQRLRPQCCPLLCLMERQHFVLSPWRKLSLGLQMLAQELSLHQGEGNHWITTPQGIFALLSCLTIIYRICT